VEGLSHLDGKEATAAARRLDGLLAAETVPADFLRVERDVWLAQRRTGTAVASDWSEQPFTTLFDRLADPFWAHSFDRYLRAEIVWASTAERGVMPAVPRPRAPRHGPGKYATPVWWYINRTGNELFLAALRLQAWRAEHGHCPDTLDALQTDAIGGLPRDPFGDGPFKYRRDGDGYVLYSVGPDRHDDGGRAVEEVQGEQKDHAVAPGSKGDYVWGVSY